MVTAGPLALAACGRGTGRYFGAPTPPSRQRLVFLNLSEPSSLDPALVSTSEEVNITRCLFEGLTRNDPLTLAPRAALATHYESDADGRLLTFYLRGHRNPRGVSLPGWEESDLRQPARWSDGSPVTAHDFVYSWRRVIDPRTASPYANFLFYVKDAEAIYTGTTARTKDLAVEAPDDFTLKVELHSPVPFFLNIAATGSLAAVPRQAIEAVRNRGFESSWAQPGRVVVSGPFDLQEWRSYDRVVLRKNPAYYDATRVRLEEVSFIHVKNGVTNVNLYKAGEADSMAVSVLPPQFLPGLRGTQELQVRPALDSYYYALNVNKPPLDNLLLRYALNMAVDKKAIAEFAGAGRAAAVNFVPPMSSYRSPQQVVVSLGGRACNVLSYDPAIARELLAAAEFSGGLLPGGRRLRINVSFPIRPLSRERAEILQQSWRRNLGIEASLTGVEFSVWTQVLASHDYQGAMEVDYCAPYADPDAFLSMFTSVSPINDPDWRNKVYDGMLVSANAEVDRAVRMQKLTECEEYLLRSMPVIPLYFDKWTYLQRPFVHGLETDPLAGLTFQSAWIDTNWRPS